jgi:ubiquinone/menaquinone biosynthesis C-methylase UbiE
MTASAGNYTNIDETDDASWFIRFSDSVNAIPEYRDVRQALLRALGPLEGTHALDVGSGPGDDTREMAALAGPSGRVVGMDLSEAMLAEAKRRGGPVEWVHGDIREIPFPDATFDRVRVKLVRQHLVELDQADDELLRVLRPGGRLASFDLDFETLVVDYPDKALLRAVMPYWVDHHKQGWCGRQMLRRFRSRGMTDVTVTPHTVAMSYEFLRNAMSGVLDEAIAAGALDITPAEWWRPLEEADEAGLFFSSLTGYVLAATR